MPNLKWSELNHLQIGKYAEYLVKMELTSYGCDVYTSEVDDHGIDFVMKSKYGVFYEVQVKAIRYDRSNYIFAQKEKFDVDNDNLLMALVIFHNDTYPEVYLLPTSCWRNESPLFKGKDYIGLKSKPEWGINISKKNYDELRQYELVKMIQELKIT